MYIGHNGGYIEIRMKEYRRLILIWQPDKSVVPEQRFSHDHHINIQDAKILFTKSCCLDRFVRDDCELELRHSNVNTADGLTLSGSWKLLIRSLRQIGRSPEKIYVMLTILYKIFLSPPMYILLFSPITTSGRLHNTQYLFPLATPPLLHFSFF